MNTVKKLMLMHNKIFESCVVVDATSTFGSPEILSGLTHIVPKKDNFLGY